MTVLSQRKTARSRPEDFLGDNPKPHPGRRMSEAEFEQWVDRYTRAEWVNGEVYIMSPVTLDHDRIQGWLYRLLCDFVEQRELGKVSGNEYLVRLPGQKARHLPDVCFVTNARVAHFKRTYFDGAPDLIVEVVSEESVARDYRLKYANYEAAGVREYWIVDPLSRKVEAHTLARKHFQQIPQRDGLIKSGVLSGLFIRPEWLWQPKPPALASVLHDLGM